MVADTCAMMLKISKDSGLQNDTVVSPFLYPAAQKDLLPACYEGDSALQVRHMLFVVP